MSQFISSQLSMCAQDHVFVADWITVGHCSFKPNAIIVNAIVDGIPQFGIIIHIVNVEKKFYFIQELFETTHFDEHFHAYAVKHLVTKRLGCVDSGSLKDHAAYVHYYCTKFSVFDANFALCFVALRNYSLILISWVINSLKNINLSE